MKKTDNKPILELLAGLVQPPVPLSVDLWDAKTIGAFLKVSPRSVTEYYAQLKDFPLPVRLPSRTGGSGRPRWKSLEVVAWAEQFASANDKTR